ncbi:putative glycolipid-binding domain-containing protein [Aquisalibacillus elongatus]|uniref:Glycolipid-binding protein n=1 Tax=Aquisalibacillus elongatus TaxID=485577 RepID=A0A3N5B4B6_9BACI|nr:putative glycolipid-binding domain-containing protein [Aquisalibacillus elongatus]RPF50390.1 hypothetical protein EDC24_2828 [Aquisalibacillus elongatus]
MDLNVLWNNDEQYGCEFLQIRSHHDQMLAESEVIYLDKEDAHHASYKVELDAHWRTRKVSVVVDHTSSITLHSDGEGNWIDANGGVMEELTGAIDIDISATPFSNSLPINRLNWNINQLEDFYMVYISVPSLEIKKVPQSYQYVRSEGEYRYFKYRCYDYETIICVDSNGLVVDYPDTFSRRL